MELDATDWVILRDLYRWDVSHYPRGPLRTSVSALAERTGLHRNSVRARLDAMREGGALEGFAFEPRPSLLGAHRAGYGFDGPSFRDADALSRALAPFPGVPSAVLASGLVFLHFWHEHGEDPDAVAGRIAHELGATGFWRSYASADFPPSDADRLALTALDWRLIAALRRNPTRSLSEVAREVGATARTTERRAERLIARGAGSMAPLFRFGRVEGWVFPTYVVEGGDPRAAGSLAKAFPDRIIGPFAAGINPNVLVPVRSVEEAERRRADAEGLPGVLRLRMALLRDVLTPSAFEEWLGKRVADAQSRVARSQVPRSRSRAT